MAAAEKGRRVLVRVGTIFEVGDHDFTKFSVIPSVALMVSIPDKYLLHLFPYVIACQ